MCKCPEPPPVWRNTQVEPWRKRTARSLLSFESGEFDSHSSQTEDGNTNEGRLARQLSVVDDVIAGYRRGLGEAWDDAIILTLTEFGRTVAVNGTRGTDHGYG